MTKRKLDFNVLIIIKYKQLYPPITMAIPAEQFELAFEGKALRAPEQTHLPLATTRRETTKALATQQKASFTRGGQAIFEFGRFSRQELSEAPQPKITRRGAKIILERWGIAEQAEILINSSRSGGNLFNLQEWSKREGALSHKEADRLCTLEVIIQRFETIFYGLSEENTTLAIRNWFNAKNTQLKNQTPIQFIKNESTDSKPILLILSGITSVEAGFQSLEKSKAEAEKSFRKQVNQLIYPTVSNDTELTEELAETLGLESQSLRTYLRNKGPQSLTAEVAEKMQALCSVMLHLERLKLKYPEIKIDIGSWLEAENKYLGGKTPIQVMQEHGGLERLKNYLAQQ